MIIYDIVIPSIEMLGNMIAKILLFTINLDDFTHTSITIHFQNRLAGFVNQIHGVLTGSHISIGNLPGVQHPWIALGEHIWHYTFEGNPNITPILHAPQMNPATMLFLGNLQLSCHYGSLMDKSITVTMMHHTSFNIAL